MIKRTKMFLRNGEVIDVSEFHDGRYGARGEKRGKRKKPTKEEMQKVNARNKTKKCRQRMIQYLNKGDLFCTLTYKLEERPLNMQEALKDFQAFMKAVRREYKKRGMKCYWFRNIECGTKGAWHIHLVINDIGDTASLIQRAWKHGGTWTITISNSKFYDEDFTKLASYMTKDENTVELKQDGTPCKPRIRESSYNTSRNMPLPEPKPDKLLRWKKEVKPSKGYYIARIYEGINPVTGYRYRQYTMMKLNRRI